MVAVIACTGKWESGRACIGMALARRLLVLAVLRQCDSFNEYNF